MPQAVDWAAKRVAIAGFGLEGRSAAEFLSDAGAAVEVFDDKAESEFPPETVKGLAGRGVRFHFRKFGPFDGFDAVVRSPGIPPHLPALEAARKQGITITSATQMFFDLCPCLIVGITGTKGKGTTASLLHRMLAGAGRDAYLCGNIGAPALDFLDALAPDSVAVYELSSFQLIELEKSPALAVVLMVTSDHLDFHSTGEEYVGSKANIVRFQKPGDRAVVNMDYPASRDMATLTPAEVFQVSRKERPQRGAYVEGGAIMLATGGDAVESAAAYGAAPRGGGPRKLMDAAQVPLAGAHNLENIAAAALAASLLGVPDAAIVQAICAFKALPHRLELVRAADGVRYFDDSISTTPDSALAAMRALPESKVMILGGSDKGADWKEFAAALAADSSVKAVIGIGEEWRRIREALRAALRAAAGGSTVPEIIEGAKSMAAAVQAAAAAAKPGWAVILSPGCASFGMFKNYQDRGEQFAAAVRALPG